MRITFFQESVSAIRLDLEIGQWDKARTRDPSEREVKKITFSLHNDISEIGSRSEINQSAFQRGKFDASNDRLLVNRKSLSSEL